jgi:O-acetyl-ADP-ribose deacetylase (regulator of RNase III)
MPLGSAAATGAGKLPFKAIIHVAGINLLWRASETSIRRSVRSAMRIADEKRFASIAFPLIGAGSGGARPEKVKSIMLDELAKSALNMGVRLVVFKKDYSPPPDPASVER